MVVLFKSFLIQNRNDFLLANLNLAGDGRDFEEIIFLGDKPVHGE